MNAEQIFEAEGKLAEIKKQMKILSKERKELVSALKEVTDKWDDLRKRGERLSRDMHESKVKHISSRSAKTPPQSYSSSTHIAQIYSRLTCGEKLSVLRQLLKEEEI